MPAGAIINFTGDGAANVGTGTGYSVGDTVSVDGVGSGAVIRVDALATVPLGTTAVDPLRITLLAAGSGYAIADLVPTTALTGTGTGFTLDILVVEAGGGGGYGYINRLL